METENRIKQQDLIVPMVITSVLYAACALVSNICSLRIVLLFGKSLDAGTFIYPFAFTMRDVSQKTLGKKNVKVLIWVTSGICLLASLVFYLISLIPEDVSASETPGAWTAVLTPVWRITLSSIIAGLAAELADTEMYSWWTEKVTKKYQWARVLISNAVSIPIDSLIFAFGAFAGTMPISSVWEIFYGNILIKAIVTLISIPMIYLVKDPVTDDAIMNEETND